jgi:hypothetical protein
MPGRAYYLTTFGEWRRHAARFATSHWLAVSPPANERLAQRAPQDTGASVIQTVPDVGAQPAAAGAQIDDATSILALIEADEGVHLDLEQHASFEALPHPLSTEPVSDRVAAALAQHGVKPGAGAFDVAELVGRAHPLLRYRVF